MKTTSIRLSLTFLALAAVVPTFLHAQDTDLAKKLSNPVAALISVPLQGNYDFGIGPGDGNKFTLNIQPVVPISLSDDWNVISRTILPVIDQQGILAGGAADASGLGDTVQSFFFSPKVSDPIWGLGPVFLLPTATTFSLNVESTYDWVGNQWNVPINLIVSQIVKLGDQPVQFFGGVRYYAEKPEGGPDWGLRFGMTFLFSKS
ncbi:transporter [bacterium]|nr:transporter [bacterium]